MSEHKTGCVPDGYMPIPTAEQLADALDGVRCYHDLGAELIAPELLANLLAVTSVKAERVDCLYCQGHGDVTRISGQTAESYSEHNEECPECKGTGLAPSLPAAGLADLTAVRCQCCATEYPHDSYDAGFIAGSGMCQVCDAAMPPKDLPAAGSAMEEVEVVGYRWKSSIHTAPDLTPYAPASTFAPGYDYVDPLMTVAQHDRIVAALSAQQSAPWAPSGADYDRAIHRNPDAKAWADLFIATFPGQADKHDLMLGWFANAMMAMYDHLKAQQSAHVSVLRETLENARRAMFAVLNQEPRMKAVAKRVLNAEIDLIDRALLNGGES